MAGCSASLAYNRIYLCVIVNGILQKVVKRQCIAFYFNWNMTLPITFHHAFNSAINVGRHHIMFKELLCTLPHSFIVCEFESFDKIS